MLPLLRFPSRSVALVLLVIHILAGVGTYLAEDGEKKRNVSLFPAVFDIREQGSEAAPVLSSSPVTSIPLQLVSDACTLHSLSFPLIAGCLMSLYDIWRLHVHHDHDVCLIINFPLLSGLN